MSLRARLLIAIGVIALVALAIADVVTYSALQSFLYQRIDQQLASTHGLFEQRLDQGGTVRCFGGPGSPFPNGTGPAGGPGPGDNGASNAFQSQAVQVRTSSGALTGQQNCPAYVDGKAYTPVIPTPLPATQAAPDGTQVAYFDAPSTQADGPTFRVRASTLANGDLLILAHAAGRHREHPPPAPADRADRDGRCRARRAGRRVLAGAHRTPAAPRHGDGGRVDRRGQPHRARARREREDRGRAPRPHPQHHAQPDRVGLPGPGGLRGAAARVRRPAPPLRGRRLPRAAHADRRHQRLCRAVRARGLRAEGGPRAPDGRHPVRDGSDGAPRRRPAAAGPPRRGPAHGDAPGRPGRPCAARPSRPHGRSVRPGR